METPSSTTRRVTRSQTLSTSANTNNIPMSRKIEESEKGISKSRQRIEKKQQDRSVLIDITNDSPIVGLAMGSLKTPLSSTLSKKKNKINTNTNATTIKTPGSGEALLRGQVKTLLQKVEEEAELSKLSLENRPFLHLINSPATLLAPTPANTPHVLNLSETSFKNTCLASVTPSPVQEQFEISQMVAEIFDGKKQQEGSSESEKSMITRSLIWDFSEKSEGYDSSECSSVLTNEGGIIGGQREGKEKLSSTDDDEASVWSIQVNASSTRDDEEEDYEDGIEEFGEDDDYEEAEEEEEDDGELVDALCEGISKISVNGEKKAMPEFTGRHTRFVYNSDDEIEGEEECGAENGDATTTTLGILRLKGLPTPKGKHLRFPMEEEEDN